MKTDNLIDALVADHTPRGKPLAPDAWAPPSAGPSTAATSLT